MSQGNLNDRPASRRTTMEFHGHGTTARASVLRRGAMLGHPDGIPGRRDAHLTPAMRPCAGGRPHTSALPSPSVSGGRVGLLHIGSTSVHVGSHPFVGRPATIARHARSCTPGLTHICKKSSSPTSTGVFLHSSCRPRPPSSPSPPRSHRLLRNRGASNGSSPAQSASQTAYALGSL